MSTLEKREFVYVTRPREFEMSGHSCGNEDPDWSEFKRHLWCARCEVDFEPESAGILDGPVPVNACYMLGVSLDALHIETSKIESPLSDEERKAIGWPPLGDQRWERVPVERLREQARAEDATYEHSITRTQEQE